MTFVDRLAPLLGRGDVRGARALLLSMSGAELRDARDWFSRSKRWLNQLHTPSFEGASHEEQFRNRKNADWIVAMCALALCGPVTAAERVPWRNLWSYRNDDGEPEFVAMLCAADRDWVRDFSAAASKTSLGGNGHRFESTLTRVLRAALVHHGLPAPEGPTFYGSWLAGGPAQSLPTGHGAEADAASLAGDPLMPELLFAYLASGHCGDAPWLPAAAAELARRGDVDRNALLEHVLGLLTAPQRPKSQAVLAQVAPALDVRADEIPGGLTYLLGVMATSHGSVSAILLPLAIDLVSDGDDLRGLTNVVVGRREVRQKTELLRALRTDRLRDVAGVASVADALLILRAGDDEAFSARVARAQRELGIETQGLERPAPPSGVWDIDPVAVTPRTRYLGPDRGSPLDANNRRADERDARLLGDRLLTDMARGEFDAERLLTDVHHLLDSGRFAAGEFARIFADLFLAGGLRQGWPAAISVADAACCAARRPSGLADLLRMLGSFAREVPQQALPAAIADLAAEGGQTKAAAEARRLGAALAGCDVDTYLAGLRGSASRAALPAARGLWHDDADVEPLPTLRRSNPVSSDLDPLRAALSGEFGRGQSHVDVCFWPAGYMARSAATSLTNPELVLAATVRAIHQHGARAVRDAVSGIEREWPAVDVIAAVDLWASEGLDVSLFWRIARKARTRLSIDQQLPPDRFAAWDDRQAYLDSLAYGAAPGDDPESVVLPASLDSAVATLAFLRASESLLLAESNPTMLAAPTWADGTLELGELLERLTVVGDAEVGPLDLVQALYRLRAVNCGDIHALTAVSARTHPALTSSEGVTTWDVREVLHTWVTAGGLPALTSHAVDGRWQTDVVAPVPWSRCAALPQDLRDDPWSWTTNQSDHVRLMPRWADRAIALARQADPLFDPRHLPSHAADPLGEPFHDLVLALLGGKPYGSREPILETVVDLARHDRLDPDVAATAALARNEAGVLATGRLTQGIADVIERGGLRGIWPSALAIATALTGVAKKPSGLPQLLRLLTSYVVEVPEPGVPDALRRFAASQGTTRSHVEARALVDALAAR